MAIVVFICSWSSFADDVTQGEETSKQILMDLRKDYLQIESAAFFAKFLKTALLMADLPPAEYLRFKLLAAIFEAKNGNFTESKKLIREAQQFLDYSFRAKKLRRNTFFQNTIDMVTWDVHRMETIR